MYRQQRIDKWMIALLAALAVVVILTVVMAAAPSWKEALPSILTSVSWNGYIV